jgi:hypothetical protein
MKNELKLALVEKVIAFLDTEKVSDVDKRKVMSSTYSRLTKMLKGKE